MNYRSILVHLDTAPTCDERVEFAIGLARALDCHLVGLAPTGLVDWPVLADVSGSVVEYADLARHALADRAERLAERFRGRCKSTGLGSFEAVVDADGAVPSVIRHARCADLAVLSQTDLSAGENGAAWHCGEAVVLESARPTLFVPYAGRFEPIAARAMVAWDDSREAARALADALPLLRRAGVVHVVTWQESDGAQDADVARRIEAVSQWLVRQGVRVQTHVETTKIDIAEAMLSRAADLDAGLIVMGAYGHARWSERILGGATRGLLTSMTMPVLMSH